MGRLTSVDRDAFVGRVAELDAMRSMLAQVRSGQARTIMVSGPAGIGKTALIEQFLHGENDVRILRAGGERWEALVSYGVVDQLLRVAGVSRTRFIAGTDHEFPAEEPATIGTWVLEVLAGLDHQTPLVVVVDDAHWADTDSLRLILFAARRLVAERVLMVFAVREENVLRLPEGLQRLAAGPTGLLLPLGNLGAEDLQRLARAFGVRDLPARTARRLREHTGGNPLYVRALLAELSRTRAGGPGSRPCLRRGRLPNTSSAGWRHAPRRPGQSWRRRRRSARKHR
jgi:ATP/maltotriose-dependent transcriptional regulator MalT